MSTSPDERSDLEELLSAALTARAEQVRPEHLAPLATATPVRRRWQSPWVLLASAAAVLLVLGVVFQGLDPRPRSDDVAPRPDEPRPDEPSLVFPPDVGRDWRADDLSSPARLDLDGDRVNEKVDFLADPSTGFAAYTRLQTTLSSTGEEAWGLAQLGSTVGVNALDPIDADADGDQELVLYREDLEGGPGAPVTPLVFDLRDGLLLEAPPVVQDLLLTGDVAAPGSATTYYDKVHIHSYWIEDGRLFSSRSVNAFARGSMTVMRPETYVVDTYEWTLGEDGLLRPSDNGCMAVAPEALDECASGQVDDPPVVSPVATETYGVGEEASYDEGYAFTARLDAAADPSLVVEGADGRTLNHGLEVADPRISTTQPTALFSDGASLVVTSASDPTYLEVIVQDGARMRALRPVGDIALSADSGARTWLTRNGALVSVIADEDDTWQAWQWVRVSATWMAAFPTGTVCFDDVDAGVTTPC